MAQIVQMTMDQLQQLLETVRVNAGAYNTGTDVSKCSFLNCCHRFGGQMDHQVVELFIDSIVAYKQNENISDDEALRSISWLFYGQASIWWQSARKEAKTWNKVLDIIRENFAPLKPAYQIYMELVRNKQDDSTTIDNFVWQKRALLAQLPEGRHDEGTEIDMIYGLLNVKYRRYLARQDVKTFRQLLEQGRLIEYNNRMMGQPAAQWGTKASQWRNNGDMSGPNVVENRNRITGKKCIKK